MKQTIRVLIMVPPARLLLLQAIQTQYKGLALQYTFSKIPELIFLILHLSITYLRLL